jgi:hypothetical protein
LAAAVVVGLADAARLVLFGPAAREAEQAANRCGLFTPVCLKIGVS